MTTVLRRTLPFLVSAALVVGFAAQLAYGWSK